MRHMRYEKKHFFYYQIKQSIAFAIFFSNDCVDDEFLVVLQNAKTPDNFLAI